MRDHLARVIVACFEATETDALDSARKKAVSKRHEYTRGCRFELTLRAAYTSRQTQLKDSRTPRGCRSPGRLGRPLYHASAAQRPLCAGLCGGARVLVPWALTPGEAMRLKWPYQYLGAAAMPKTGPKLITAARVIVTCPGRNS